MIGKDKGIIEKIYSTTWLLVLLWFVSLALFGLSFIDGNRISTLVTGTIAIMFTFAIISKTGDE